MIFIAAKAGWHPLLPNRLLPKQLTSKVSTPAGANMLALHSHPPLQTCLLPCRAYRQWKTSPLSTLPPSLSLSLISNHPSINPTVRAENLLMSAIFQCECKSPEISSCWVFPRWAPAPVFVTWWHQGSSYTIKASAEALHIFIQGYKGEALTLGCREDAGRGIRHAYMSPIQYICPFTRMLRDYIVSPLSAFNFVPFFPFYFRLVSI